MCNKVYKEVLHLVAEETEISTILIESKSRLADVVDARQMVVWFCFKAGMSPSVISKKVGISRQAVCQKIATIEGKRRLKSFEFIFKRIESAVGKIF